ncbi:alanine--tRNA ligase [Natronogracilivirga saccharolytica]|uniref:Alanine--tRNA ligase n=1 Tax=Natronogracilivirga saccharolytica TaxID=2812953 RepID=A0A8J7UVB1_9BACT|nr:alanine--tRNA ligase [Natronogracilivirga saccharolytica]MBP3193265.1 alanine--tRNA ligase [Natronogracilivirga saccharolytica]
MSVRSSHQIRRDFFEFFREKKHIIVESAPVVPENDPTLLFINAGMNPFKPIFLGEEQGLKRSGKQWQRAANTQKCIRVSGKHNDLDEVGHDTYHHTLFEMLGNWSFGDYFKKEAIAWAWELLVDRWGLEPDRLYATVFEGDDRDGLPADEEAAGLWASETPIAKDHILKYGKADNFWEMGDTGPCGPCSEVHIDLRPDAERKKVDGATLVNQDDPRVMEIWNLVFIQFNRQKDGSLNPLPARHVDTGMGFERIVAVLQGKRSNYDTDIFTPLLDAISKRAGVAYGKAEQTDIAMRVVADHIRAVSFAVADGAAPSNEDRGYVIRRILRRASRYAWDRLNIREAFMAELVDVLAEQFADVFPELKEKKRHVTKVVTSEETSFLRTLDQGIAYFNQMTESMSGGQSVISGDDAFKLHDTYGFPIDLTELMARERGLKVDHERFHELMEEQKDRARKAGKFKSGEDDDQPDLSRHFSTSAGTGSEFTGYDERKSTCRILEVQDVNGRTAVLLDRTPFYAESGGQISDTGVLANPDSGVTLNVKDVADIAGHRVHFVDKMPDSREGTWIAAVDADRRAEIERHHTATHLLHAALRETLGNHVAQRGSLVAPDRLRFDFSHYEPVTQEQLDEIEQRVNEKVRQNIPMEEERDVPIDEAKKRGAMMLFGEKYGERVRIVTFDPDYSVELCGGTHVDATGKVGYLRLVSESSVAAGIRRLEAVSGSVADTYLRSEKHMLQNIRRQIGTSGQPDKEIERLMEERKQLEKELSRMNRLKAGLRFDELLSGAEATEGGIRLVAGEIEDADMNTLKQLGYDGLDKAGEKTVIVLGARDEEKGKAFLMAAVTDDLIASGIKAGELVGKLAKTVGGGGGGQPNLATAGGKKPDQLQKVFDQAKDELG